MRAVQTFWTAKGNPMTYSFGWTHPRYNAMSWALSCLTLRQHFEKVELYTDTAGYNYLVEHLGLPYTRVHVVLDDFFCLPYHWALSKIKTYSIQESPFVHVDGDVFLPMGLPHSLLASPLLAQNRERSTAYYRRMMDSVLRCPGLSIPDNIRETITQESVPSYNMGLFGGTDLEFVHRYCHEAFQFMDINHLNDPKYSYVSLNCNVFVEQILFAVMADREHRKVACMVNREINDNGYSMSDFCDFLHFESKPIHHVLGGHKRKEDNYLMLEMTLLRCYPKYYRRIMKMFPEHYERNYNQIVSGEGGSSGVYVYDEFVRDSVPLWGRIGKEGLFEMDCHSSWTIKYFCMSESERAKCLFAIEPYARIFDCTQLSEEEIEILKKRLDCERFFPLCAVALRPTLTGNRMKEVPLQEEEAKIIQRLKSSSVHEEELRRLLVPEEVVGDSLYNIVFTQSMYTLIRNGLVIIENS